MDGEPPHTVSKHGSFPAGRNSVQADEVSYIDHLNALCITFQNAWHGSPRPQIADFLAQAPPESEETLLRNLLSTLLARDPAVRPDALAVAQVACQQHLEQQTRGHGASDGALVARDQQLASLRDALAKTKQHGEAATFFVSGKSGEGKTALVEHFLAAARRVPRTAIMSGRCYDRESVPF